MTGPLYRLGGLCSRHHWPVIGLWLLEGDEYFARKDRTPQAEAESPAPA